MNMLRYFRSLIFPDQDNQVVRYQRLRRVLIDLGNRLVRQLSREDIFAGARALGMLRGKQLLFNTEGESSVLMDYCVYDVLGDGRNAVERYVAACPPEADTDEGECLRAMLEARYALLLVLSAEEGVGCQVRDLLTGKEHWLADMGLALSAQPGLILATRVLDFGEFITTGGAALPLTQVSIEDFKEWEAKFRSTRLVNAPPAEIIRWGLRQGVMEKMAYAGIDPLPGTEMDEPQERTASAVIQPRQRTNPKLLQSPGNQRCRCGSGKMFKNCCGRKAR